MFKFDRTTSQAFKAEEHTSDFEYWKGKSVVERLQAAYYLNASVYGFSPETEPKLDRTCFSARKRD